MPLVEFKPLGAVARELRKTAQHGWGTVARFSILVAVLTAAAVTVLAFIPR